MVTNRTRAVNSVHVGHQETNMAGEVNDYSGVKTPARFCDGLWRGQFPAVTRTLAEFGHPAKIIKRHRGGMQNGTNLGLAKAE